MLRMRQTFARIDLALSWVESALMFLLLGVSAVFNFIQVVGRYLFGASFSSLQEVSVYLIVWMVFVGIVHADRYGRAISLDLLYNYMSPTGQKLLWRICDALLALTALALCYSAYESTVFSRMIGEISVSRLAAPIWLVMIILPISFLALAIRAAIRAFTGRHVLSVFDELEMQE